VVKRLCSCFGRGWRARASLGALIAVPVKLRDSRPAEDLAAVHQHRDELSWRSDAWGRARLIQLSDLLQAGMPVQNILYIDILKAGGKRRAAAKATSTVPASPSW
jgi:hypothetical protein